MYSEQCKSCIVEGCPDSCSVKINYKRDFERVVRCKDCKHYDIEIPSRCIKDRCYCATVDSFMKPMDYCSYAERRNNED